MALVLATLAGCSKPQQTPPAQGGAPAAAASAPAGTPAPTAPPDAGAPSGAAEREGTDPTAALPEELRSKIDQPFTGDFEAMAARRVLRVAVTFNRTYYFVDKGAQRGLAYEYLTVFEDQLNQKRKTGNLKIHLVFVPMSRDQLLPSLTQGKVDMVVAQLTVTPARQAVVDFTQPTRRNVAEVLVTGPGAPAVTSADELSGREVFARKTSSYYESLVSLNERLKAAGKAPVTIRPASEHLEDDDLLEMVNAGLLPAIVVDDYLAHFWKQVFPRVTVHDTVTLRTGSDLAVAIRKNSPQLAAELNAFIARQGLDTSLGAILNKRYLHSTKFVKNATSDEERRKFETLIATFRKYGERYSFDYLLMAAQGYQESRLDQQAKSSVGAIGVMQLMPETGREQKVGDVRQIDPNIHAGVKYMRFIRDAFFEKEPMTPLDKGLFTFAAYNAGPGRIRQLRQEAARRGLNPNVWFGNVERIASERIGRETVTYVSNIYKYYVAYRLLQEQRLRKTAAGGSLH